MNCVDYLCDNSGLMTLRSKEFKLRLLDQTRFEADVYNVRIANVIIPVLVVLLFAGVKLFSRRRKFAK